MRKKSRNLVLTLLFLGLGIAVILLAVNASRVFHNALLIGYDARQTAVDKVTAAWAEPYSAQQGFWLWVYGNLYPALGLGVLFLAAGIYFMKLYNGQSERSAKITKTVLSNYRPIAILVLVTAVFSCLHARFLTVGNFTNILKQISHYAILAAGVYFAILLGGIDISVGSVAGFSGAVGALCITHMDTPLSALVAVVVCLMIGALSGLMNGYFIARRGLQPMIVTLASMSIFRGATMVITNGAAISLNKTLPGYELFSALGQRSLFNGLLPLPIIIMAIVYAIVYYMLNITPFGRHMYAIGGNEEASLLSGIDVARTKAAAHMASGLMAAIAGIIITARVASATPTAGEGYEMDAIAAVVIGGTSLRGGEGKVLYTLVGALIIGMLNNILNLTNVSAYYQTIVKGVVILTAVLLDARSQKR